MQEDLMQNIPLFHILSIFYEEDDNSLTKEGLGFIFRQMKNHSACLIPVQYHVVPIQLQWLFNAFVPFYI